MFRSHVIKKLNNSILETVTTQTDIDKFDLNKKIKLFDEAKASINDSRGTLSKELKFIIGHMVKTVKDLNKQNNILTSENAKLKLPIPPVVSNERSFSQVVQNKKKKTEFIVLVKKSTEEEIDVKKEVLKNLRSVENEITIQNMKSRNET